jgi:hypothetical protein
VCCALKLHATTDTPVEELDQRGLQLRDGVGRGALQHVGGLAGNLLCGSACAAALALL